jgi:hypothetical protein
MGFDLGAFIAGASEGAASSIDKRNKEIRQAALREFEQLQKQSEEQTEKLRTKRDELKATADVLSSYRGANNTGFTQAQVVGLLQNPAVAKRVAEQLKANEDGLDQIDFAKLYTVTKGKTDITTDEFIKQSTSIAIPTVEAPQKVVRGAFGLESPAFAQAQAEFEASTGKSLKEVRATAKGVMPSEAVIEGVVDFSQFKKPDTLASVQAQLRDLVANGGDTKTGKGKMLMDKLAANAIIESKFKEGEGKERTTAQINSVFNQSLRVGMEPLLIKGTVRFNAEANDYVPIVGDAASIREFQDQKNKIVRNQAIAMGILDNEGNIIGGRNSQDALLPYANIEKGKVVSWRTVTPAEGEKKPAAPAAAPAKPTTTTENKEPSKSVVFKDVLPIPKTADGRVDGSQLVAGKQYRAADNTVKTWNGTSWQ